MSLRRSGPEKDLCGLDLPAGGPPSPALSQDLLKKMQLCILSMRLYR